MNRKRGEMNRKDEAGAEVHRDIMGDLEDHDREVFQEDIELEADLLDVRTVQDPVVVIGLIVEKQDLIVVRIRAAHQETDIRVPEDVTDINHPATLRAKGQNEKDIRVHPHTRAHQLLPVPAVVRTQVRQKKEHTRKNQFQGKNLNRQ